MLSESAAQLALAEAMRLHEERVRRAIEQTRDLRAALEIAEAHQRVVMQARDEFKKAVRHV